MPSIEVIYLARQDTVETIRELLQSAAPGAQVWLVAPWRWPLGRDLVSLQRMRRAGQVAAVDLRLVSPRAGARALAHVAGLPAYAMVPLRLRRYKRLRRPGAEGLAARVLAVDGRLGRWWRKPRRHLGIGAFLLSLIVVALLAAAMAGVTLALWPMATLTLQPVSRPVTANLEVTADPTYHDVDANKSAIPARVISVIVEGRGDTPTTGRVEQPDAYAVGEVVFSNKTSNPVRVPKGTIVRSGAGTAARFRTMADVSLPGTLYASARVGVTAVEPGSAGNVQPLTINVVEGEVARSADVLNDRATQGGLMKMEASVAPQDFDRLRTDLVQRLQKETYAQLVAGLQPGEFIPPNSLDVQVMSQKFDQVASQQAPLLSMSMKVVVKGVAVDGQALQTLAQRVLESRAGAGLGIVGDSLKVERSTELHVEKNNVVRFSAKASGEVASAINVERVKAAMRGRTVAQATQWLSRNLQLASPPQIVMEPEWWEYMPLLPGRISVSISVGSK